MNRIKEALDIAKRAKELGDYDSNVIGMVAEIIAEDELNLEKATTGKKAIDGYWKKECTTETVQVKSFSSGRVKRYKGGAFFRLPLNGADNLIVILIYSLEAEYEILYSGKTNQAGEIEKNGKNRVVCLDSLVPSNKLQQILKKVM